MSLTVLYYHHVFDVMVLYVARNTFCERWYLPHSQVYNDPTIPIIIGLTGCIAHARNGHRVPRPRFPTGRRNFGDSRVFKADIGLLNICMDFRDLLA